MPASPFSPWATAAPSASEADASSAASNASGEALAQAAAELSQAAAQLAELGRSPAAAPDGGSSSVAVQITVTDAAGDELPYSASTIGPDLSLLP